MSKELVDKLMVLLLLLLVALGSKMTFHFLALPQAHSSGFLHRARTALLTLLLVGEATLLLELVFLISGNVFILPEFLLSRIMGPICSFLFVNACVHYRGCTPQLLTIARPQPLRYTMTRNVDDVDNGKRTYPKRSSSVTAMKKRVSDCVGGLESASKRCLWAVAMVLTVINFLDAYNVHSCLHRPCLIFNPFSPSLPKGNVFEEANENSLLLLLLQKDSKDKTYDGFGIVYALVVDKNHSETDEDHIHWIKKDFRLREEIPEWLPYWGMCVHGGSDHQFLLHCLFFSLLLVYLFLSLLGSRRDLIHDVSNLVTLPPDHKGTTSSEAFKIRMICLTIDSGSSLRQAAGSIEDIALYTAAACSVVSEGSHQSANDVEATTVKSQTFADECTDVHKVHLHKSQRKVPNKQPKSNLLVDTLEELDRLPPYNLTVPNSSNKSKLHSYCRLQTQTLVTPTIVACRPSLQSIVSHIGVVPKGDDQECVVCQKLTPYVFLTSLLLIVQQALCLVLWAAEVWVKCKEVQEPSPAFLFLPAYCAICFVFRIIQKAE